MKGLTRSHFANCFQLVSEGPPTKHPIEENIPSLSIELETSTARKPKRHCINIRRQSVAYCYLHNVSSHQLCKMTRNEKRNSIPTHKITRGSGFARKEGDLSSPAACAFGSTTDAALHGQHLSARVRACAMPATMMIPNPSVGIFYDPLGPPQAK